MTLSTPPFALRRAAPRLASGLVLAVLAATALLAGCGDKKDKAASQTAAKVNRDEITVHQINFVLQQQRNLRPEQAEAAGRQVLERLIDQQLALQKADDQKLDRDPRVVQALEAARREILARAYIEKVGEGAAKPTPDEIRKYYAEHPELFAERRIYNIQEIAIEARPEQVPEIREKLGAAKNIAEFVEYLKSKDIRFQGNQAVRAAEQLPLGSLKSFANLKDGQAVVVPSANGVQVIVLAGSRSQPVSEDQARPAIESYLLNERKRKLIEEEIKAMRSAAKIEYVGKFAEGAPPAGGAPAAAAPGTVPGAASAAPALAPPASPGTAASSGLTSTDINRGLKLK